GFEYAAEFSRGYWSHAVLVGDRGGGGLPVAQWCRHTAFAGLGIPGESRHTEADHRAVGGQDLRAGTAERNRYRKRRARLPVLRYQRGQRDRVGSGADGYRRAADAFARAEPARETDPVGIRPV